jgi:hypothetical protein
MASNDPQFEEKAADITGLYMNPPQRAALFCVDEKSAIQGWIVWTPRCPYHPVAQNDMDSSTTGMERSHCARPWT